MKQDKQKYINFFIAILVIALGIFFIIKNNEKVVPTENNVEIKDSLNDLPEVNTPSTTKEETKTENKLTKEQKNILSELQNAVNTHNFETFALALEKVYKNQWSKIKKFTKLESELYVYVTDTYWKKGDLKNSLKVSTIVYNKVPEAWRFRYLRIVTLEKYGRNAFNV